MTRFWIPTIVGLTLALGGFAYAWMAAHPVKQETPAVTVTVKEPEPYDPYGPPSGY